MNPEQYSREQVAHENYSGGAQRNLERGRLDYQVELHIPSHGVRKVTKHSYLYPSETLRLDDYEIRSISSNQRWIELRRTAVVATTGLAAAGLSVVVAGMVFESAGNLYSSCQSAQQKRTLALQQDLKKIVQNIDEDNRFFSVKLTGEDGVCICCSACGGKAISDVYRGGILWATNLDSVKICKYLIAHKSAHLWSKYRATVELGLVVIGIVAAIAFCGRFATGS